VRTQAENKWTLDWLRARVRQGHHQVLTEYLTKRDAATKADHIAAGWSTDRIVREGFDVSNGMTAVPQAAIKCLRHCSDLDPKIVWDLVQKTIDMRQHELLETVLEKILAKIPISGWNDRRSMLLREIWQDVRNHNTVHDVMES
jgi:hypothetical protein